MPVPQIRVFLLPRPGNSSWQLLRSILARQRSVRIVGEVAPGGDALAQLAALSAPPDLLCLSAWGGDHHNFADFQRAVVSQHDPRRIALFSRTYAAAIDTVRAELGIPNYLCWDELAVQDGAARTPHLLVGTVLALLQGVVVQSPSVSAASRLHAAEPTGSTTVPRISLTAREREVLTLLLTGETDKSVAAALDITVSTVGDYVTHLYRKLDARSRVQLGVRASALGLVSADCQQATVMAISLPAWRDRHPASGESATAQPAKIAIAP